MNTSIQGGFYYVVVRIEWLQRIHVELKHETNINML